MRWNWFCTRNVQDYDRRANWITRVEGPASDPKVIQAALGPFFDKKVKFAKKSGLIDDEMTNSLIHLHSFRNSSYHRGEHHEGILHSLAVFYFCCTCEVFKSYKPSFFGWSSSDTMPHRAAKYLGPMQFFAPSQEMVVSAFERLRDVASGLHHNVVQDLSSDMRSTIDDIDSGLDFLATDGPKKLTRQEALIEAQVWAFAFTDEAKKFVKESGGPVATMRGYIDWLTSNYSWATKSDPLPSWRSRLKNLEASKNAHEAVG